jgi:release factor glutamine methyltransferase
VEALEKAHFSNASLEAKWLLAGALSKDPSFITLNPSYCPSKAEGEKIQSWLMQRVEGVPLSRLKGVREFWSLPFCLNAYTLDPRPDTEVLIEGVLRWVGDRKTDPWRILDLGTGSGCILISLLSELPHATGLGVDIQEGALAMARHNGAANGVEARADFQLSHWAEKVEGLFDIIVSNPPYIPLVDQHTLGKEVRAFDPAQALFGGEDGLACYRILAQQVKSLLAPSGLAVFEMGQGQRPDVEVLFHQRGFKTLFIDADLAGIERVLGVVTE